MKSLRPMAGHPLLRVAFDKPMRVTLPENSPECVKTYLIASDGTPVAPIIQRELGLNPGSLEAPRWYDSIPDLRIHELSGVLLCNGALYSGAGGFFPESVRIFDQNNHIRRYYNYRDNCFLRRLGNGYYIPQRYHEDQEPALVECEEIVLPFFTMQAVYGHWLLEGLTCLWAWEHVRRLAGGRRPKLLLSPIHEVPAYVKDFCLPFGITEDDYLFPASSCMRLHRLFLPTRAYMHMGYVSATAKESWNTIAAYYDQASSLVGLEKMYISRRRVKSRSLLNEAECEEVFIRHGFNVIHPQELSLADQIRLFAEARYIAGPVGSGMHNVVFSRHPGALKTLFLAPRDFASLSAIAVIEQSYGRTANFAYGQERQKGGPNTWSLDVKNLEEAVEQWL